MSRYPLFPKDEERSRLFRTEKCPEVDKDPHLVFVDTKGKIRAGCYFGDYPHVTFDLGIIPDDVANQGKAAIRGYADKKMHALIEQERTRRNDRAARIQGLHREYEIEHNSIVIRGFVKKDRNEGARANFMKLTMTEPFKLESLLYISPQCWADAMAGNRSFDDDGNLTEREIRCQEKTLVAWYKQERRRRNKPPAHPALTDLQSSPHRRHLDDEDDE